MIDECQQRLLLRTEISQSDLRSHFNEQDFYRAIYRQIAIKIADKIFEQVGPSIDKAMQEWKFEAEKKQ